MKLQSPSSRGGIRLAGAVMVALLAAAAFSSSAQACPYSGARQVFAHWGDSRNYVLAPDGGFESGGAGWSLRGAAKVVDGNESYSLNRAGDSKSLSLPAGSSAASPPICMAIDTPVFPRTVNDRRHVDPQLDPDPHHAAR